jgi:phenylacetate-CoA ligase
MYGMTETNTLGMFCKQNRLHLIENRTWFEVVDPETGEPCEDGTPGELVVTSLQSEALPLLRYRTGDLCRIDAEPCNCGSAFRTVAHLGRIGDRVMVDGQSISQLQMEDIIITHLEAAPYYFSFKVAGDALVIGLTANNLTEQVRRSIQDDVQSRYRIHVTFVTITKEAFEQSIRTAVKPTMKNFLLD